MGKVRQFIKIIQKRAQRRSLFGPEIGARELIKKIQYATDKQVETSANFDRLLIKTFHALCKKGSNGSIFSKPCDGEGVGCHKAWLSPLCTSLSTAHRVYFSQIWISRSVLLLAGWCVEVRGGVCGRGWLSLRPLRARVSQSESQAGPYARTCGPRESCLISKAPPTIWVGRARSPTSLCYLRVNILSCITFFCNIFLCCAVTREVLCEFGFKVWSGVRKYKGRSKWLSKFVGIFNWLLMLSVKF